MKYIIEVRLMVSKEKRAYSTSELVAASYITYEIVGDNISTERINSSINTAIAGAHTSFPLLTEPPAEPISIDEVPPAVAMPGE